jgi:broad specificity phosphatase PhoE
MSVLYLVRHGQASFGTDDYDRLSDLGKAQSRTTGRFLASQGIEPDRIVHGEMLRQRQTAEGLLEGMGLSMDAHVDSGWNEYAAWELTGVLDDVDPRAKHDSKIFQGELERGAARWASGEHDEDYRETYKQFTSRVERALDDAVAAMGSGQSTIVVSSAGAIAWTAVPLDRRRLRSVDGLQPSDHQHRHHEDHHRPSPEPASSRSTTTVTRIRRTPPTAEAIGIRTGDSVGRGLF